MVAVARRGIPGKRMPALVFGSEITPPNYLSLSELERIGTSDLLVAFGGLTRREREVLFVRYGMFEVDTGLINLLRAKPVATLKDTGGELGISATRSWNLENAALSKLRRALISMVRDPGED